MITRRAFACMGVASVVALSARPAFGQSSTAVQRRAEVAELRRFAETTHPRGREAAANADWRARWTSLHDRADRLGDGAYFVETRRALGWFDDGHTTVLPFEFTGGVPDPLRSGPFALSLPFSVRVFHDGVYISAAAADSADLLGAHLTDIGTLDAASLVRQVARDWPGSDAWAHCWAARAFVEPAMLHGFGAIADPGRPIRLQSNGRSVEVAPAAQRRELRPMERRQSECESWALAARGGNYVRPLPERNALYLSIDEMGDTAARTFEVLTRDAFGAIEASDAARLVVDLRRNGGGDNYLGEALRKRIAASRFNRHGALFVLIGPQTFSAAQNLASRLERETFALFVGEPTGGAPNHYGDAQTTRGEATGITSMVSTIPWFDSYPEDRRPWIMPDLLVPATFADWRDGRDSALGAALAHRVDGQTDELNRDRIFYFRRPTQQVEWRPFWREAGTTIL